MKDFDGAIADYTRAIGIDPQNAAAFNNRGNAYDAQGELDKARGDFDRAIELNANMLDAYMNRGLTLIRQGKDAEAEKDFAHYLRYASDMKDTLDKLVREARDSRQLSVVH
jgi:tetratricopeptide (TPR) repeat protein